MASVAPHIDTGDSYLDKVIEVTVDYLGVDDSIPPTDVPLREIGFDQIADFAHVGHELKGLLTSGNSAHDLGKQLAGIAFQRLQEADYDEERDPGKTTVDDICDHTTLADIRSLLG